MREEGLQPIFPMEDLAVMGLWELLPHIINFRVNLHGDLVLLLLEKLNIVSSLHLISCVRHRMECYRLD